MSQDNSAPAGPDLTHGVALADFTDGKLAGHVGDQEVLLVRLGADIAAIDAHCSHYHAPLVDGLVVGNTIRCPWHHACFDLRTGEAVRAPAFNQLSCWKVEQRDGKVFVREKRAVQKPEAVISQGAPEKIVIVGGGAAGFAAADMLRRRGFGGSITMLSREANAPIDRPNLSKDYLAGNAPEEWMPLQPDDWYKNAGIALHTNIGVSAIDTTERIVRTVSGESYRYDRLLMATGAEPVRLNVPGADQPHVHTLRTLADSRAIIAAVTSAHRVVVVGASFIGLEVAAALRARECEVHVVAPETRPMERVLGPEMGDFIRALHEEHGVVFHLGETVTAIEAKRAVLKSGAAINADLVVVGIGVRPRIELAERAGLTLDHGVVVDAHLETSAPGVFAAGDIARWPDPYSGENIRVEHWVVAERQGQVAARNMLGERLPFDAVPFFWSQHYDIPINYVGHAEHWDEIAIDGDISAKDCLLRYKSKGRVLAVASIFRDIASLQAELDMEKATNR